MSPGLVASWDLEVEVDFGQFYLVAGTPFAEDWDPDGEQRAFDVACSSDGIGQIGQLIAVLSPHQVNLAMPLRVEVWDAAPPDDLDAWAEAFEASLRVDARGLAFTSPTMPTRTVAVPVGRYRLLVVGRGFVSYGWPGSTKPGDEWRLQLWTDDAQVSAHRVRAWTGPAAPSSAPPAAEVTKAEKSAQIAERIQLGGPELWYFSGLPLDEDYHEIIADAIRERTDPVFVDISNAGLTALPEWLRDLPKVTGLISTGNDLSAVPDWIGELATLATLYLDGPRLQSLPDALGRLTALTSLGLFDTGLTELPACIGQLSALDSLSVTNAPQLRRLPPEIGALSNLRHLDLSGCAVHTLPAQIGDLSRLEHLTARHSALSVLPDEIGHLTNLIDLDLTGSQLGTVPDTIGQLTNLVDLHLGWTPTSTLPDSIGGLTHLTHLSLENTHITALPDTIGDLTSLQTLNLRDTAIAALPDSIANLSTLTLFALSNTKISSLPEAWATLPNLQFLDLEGVQLEMPDVFGPLARRENSQTLLRVPLPTPSAAATAERGSPGATGAKSSREKKRQVVRERIADQHGYWLDLTRIRFDEEYDEILWDIAPTLTDPIIVNMYRTGIRTLPRWLTRLPRLVGLLVHENRLVDLPDWLPELNRLERMTLALNPGIVAVPDIVAALPSLRRLDLDDTGITRLPESMRTMTRLEQLTLSNTPLASLPNWIGDLRNLRQLHLTDTPIQTLPESIGRLENLETLLLDRTALTALPDSIRELPNLRVTLDGTAIPHA